MQGPDLNLLTVLDALLTEGSVAGAARRLGLSPSAMSRALSRVRRATGDPLLVRAGRRLVPTPRALELQDHVGRLLGEVRSVLAPQEMPDLRHLERTFTIRSSEGFVESFGPRLIALVAAQAPGIRLTFVPKPDKDSAPLRDGSVDLETGVVGPTMGPELRAQALFRDRFIGAIRPAHPLASSRIDASRYAAARHVSISRPGIAGGPVDRALQRLHLTREIAVTVSGFAAALALARRTDLVATVPERHTEALRDGLWSFLLPVDPPEITVSLVWHPRLDADPAHRWLRDCLRQICAE